jgi:hypothetical protein
VVCTYGASNEQHALGACIESSQGHVISLLLHGWHLSSSLRTFLARLVVPELDLRATAHIQRCGQTPDPTKVWGVLTMLFTATHGSAAPTGPWRGSIGMPLPDIVKAKDPEVLAADLLMRKANVAPQRFLVGIIRQLGSCHGPAGGAPAAGPSAFRGSCLMPPNLARRGEIKKVSKKDTET